MELKITFKENEIRDLYYETFDHEEHKVDEELKERKNGSLILGGIALFFFILTYFHGDWIYYALFFSMIAILFTAWSWVIRQKSDSKIYDEMTAVDKFLVRYRTIESMKYTYDKERIQYYESGQLAAEMEWNNLIGIVKNEKWIYVRFKNIEHNIWIARATVEEQDIQLFEQAIEETIAFRSTPPDTLQVT